MSEFENVTTPPPPSTSGISPEERQWAMFAHLSGLLAACITGGLASFVGPLIIWLVKKDTMPFVDNQGKEALNFNITFNIIILALWILTFVTLGLGGLIAMPLMFVFGIAALVFVVLAAIKSNAGEAYRYPVALRLVK
ncbi:MAG TPA: DUF4870 domain-containing protein [Pseudoxanthomonas sp.]|jgi:uncharacterized Tic20 family protein|nr:DUF4870 domain-containing protein [Pseudoxanthomonas sp.]